MVSLAFEYYDAKTVKEATTDINRSRKDFQLSFLDFITYSYSYIGLMTGPFYTYRTFIDMVYQDARNYSTVWPAARNLKLLPAIVVPYIFLAKFFPLSYMETTEYLEHEWGVMYQLVILVPTFTWFRWRFYIGWLLAESMCIAAGLGAYPFECKSRAAQGPTEKQANHDKYDMVKAAIEHDGDTHE